MKDLNRYVTKKYAADWVDIGLELGLQLHILNVIGTDYPNRSTTCFRIVLDRWLNLTTRPTWKTLEVALTNVKRQQLGLDPVKDVYGKYCVLGDIVILVQLNQLFTIVNTSQYVHIVTYCNCSVFLQ